VPGNIGGVRERWLSKRAVFLHLGCLLFVPFCIAATWWQITRAEDGNGLSYLYTFEWPVFAVVGIYFWWQFLHTDYETVGLKGMRHLTTERAPDDGTDSPTASATPSPDATSPVPTPVPSMTRTRDTPRPLSPATPAARAATHDDEDPELAAYNARLAALATGGGKTWRKRETHIARRPQ
jgi:hypothetical protein